MGTAELSSMIKYTFKPHLSFPCPRSAILGILDLGLPLLLASVSKLAQQRLCRGYRVSQREREGDKDKHRDGLIILIAGKCEISCFMLRVLFKDKI